MATRAQSLELNRFLPSSRTLNEQQYRVAKRALDIVLAALLLMVLAPLMAAIALAIVIDSRGPAIFRQERVLGSQRSGHSHPERHTFCFLKFRTMVNHADDSAHRDYMRRLIAGESGCVRGQNSGGPLYKLVGDPRITRVGRILRKTSLDELPQLVNILRGDMSFVGPRPAIPYEVAEYRRRHLSRLSVPQGLTGLWQVMGRNQLSFDEMCALDSEYARRRCLLLDVRILLATVPAVLGHRGVC